MLHKIWEKLYNIKLFKFGWDLYMKYEEAMNYLIFGFLAFLVNMVVYMVSAHFLRDVFAYGEMVANGIAWVLSVLFAYWTNRSFVFKSGTTGRAMLREFQAFVSCRIVTGVLDFGIMYVFVYLMHTNDNLAKLICNVVVILSNYVFSKLWIFKKQK